MDKETVCDCKGFTLIELLIVLSLSTIFVYSAVSITGIWQESSRSYSGASKIISALNAAQERSIAGLNDSAHGVYFSTSEPEGDYAILYQGESFVERENEYDKIYELNRSLTLSTNLIDSDINYSKGDGLPDEEGLITIESNSSGREVNLSINKYGLTEQIN